MKTKEDFIDYIGGHEGTEFVATDLLDKELERLEKGRFITPHNAFFRKIYKHDGRIKLGDVSGSYANQKSFLYALALGYIQRGNRGAAVDDCAEEIKGANRLYNLEEKIEMPYMRKHLRRPPRFLKSKEPKIPDVIISKIYAYIHAELDKHPQYNIRLGGSDLTHQIQHDLNIDWSVLSYALDELKKQGAINFYKDGPYKVIRPNN